MIFLSKRTRVHVIETPPFTYFTQYTATALEYQSLLKAEYLDNSSKIGL